MCSCICEILRRRNELTLLGLWSSASATEVFLVPRRIQAELAATIYGQVLFPQLGFQQVRIAQREHIHIVTRTPETMSVESILSLEAVVNALVEVVREHYALQSGFEAQKILL